MNLGVAGNFAILTTSGITNVPTSTIDGTLAPVRITAAAMNTVLCSEVTGSIYGVDAAYTGGGDTTCFKGTAPDKTFVDNAVLDMGAAYTDAAGRAAGVTELGAGDISGMTLAAGVYKWGTGVVINSGCHTQRQRNRCLDLPDRARHYPGFRYERELDRRRTG